LETSVLAARRAAESASRAAIEGLGVFAERRPEHLDANQAALRNGLRAKWRQLGNDRELLIAECAYEQWHRLLFARFLAENNLLLHPQYKAPVTLADCEELAAGLGEPDAWSVAARFAAEILPGIFRLDDPCVQLRLAPEGRHALEQILDALPVETFVADDALGWVYQFWQKDKKDEVNASGRKIGGADLGPVTQLFTENYMVRFLLENSLGAWWAARHPDSPLVKGYDYLRFDSDGRPAAGSFDGWPDSVAEVTVMDPCCGSGHFLIEAFSMLWHMRAEEQGLAPVDAQDAVLRDNLFGLELDARCVQIAMFNVASQAWKAGGSWRQLPVPHIACSGIPVKAPVEEWKALAGGDERLENALVRLHILFRDADTLGSLIDPKRAVEISDPTGLQTSLEDVEWGIVAPTLARAMQSESPDPTSSVLGSHAVGLLDAAHLLSQPYTLVATNVPYLGRGYHATRLKDFADRFYNNARSDIATIFLSHILEMLKPAGSAVILTPQNWLTLKSYEALRKQLLQDHTWNAVALLGEHGFGSPAAAGAFAAMLVLSGERPGPGHKMAAIDLADWDTPEEKAAALQTDTFNLLDQTSQIINPDSRVLLVPVTGKLLSEYAEVFQGLKTGDNPRFIRAFWEFPNCSSDWILIQSAPTTTAAFASLHSVLLWESGAGELSRSPQARVQGRSAWGRDGVLVSEMRSIPRCRYLGEAFESSAACVVPRRAEHLEALWHFMSSSEYSDAVRRVDRKLSVATSSFTKVPFDIDRWRKVAEEAGPLPEPWSDDPTQWLFDGRPETSTAPLQVAVSRLLGYRWPEQAEPDDLDAFADLDGVVCLPAVAGEAPAVDRLQQVLAAAFGQAWSPGKAKQLLEQAGSKKKNLPDWLRDEFFKQHCALFQNRPFIWHIWDGQRDGFSALVNYHRLDRKTLEKLTYSYLGQDWVERQRAEVLDEVPGAEARLSAALELQQKLEAILEGEAPFDIYVRWKEPYEQPIGWEPDLNDGVRLNVRPFVEAGVLRSSFNVHWRKDRGKNPDGSERENDRHFTVTAKLGARRKAGRA
jgi:hypothetical protein